MPKKKTKRKKTTTKKATPAKKSTRRRRHLQLFEEECLICKHPQRSAIEELYMRNTPMTHIAELAARHLEEPPHPNQLVRELQYHVQALDLTEKRLGNWKNLYQSFLDAGADALALGEVSPDTRARLALQAQKQLDEIEGRTDKARGDTPSLTFVAIPAPGGATVKIPAQITDAAPEAAPLTLRVPLPPTKDSSDD